MHVAGVIVFESADRPVTMRELRRHVAARLRRLPRFEQRVRPSWMGLGRPEWEDVRSVDIDAHLVPHRLRAPGGPAQLDDLCARIHEEPLPRDRPLWQVHLIDGVAGGRQALVIKTHHAITDGIAGIKIAEAMFDRVGPARWPADGGLPALHFSTSAGATMMGLAQGVLGLAYTVAGGPIAAPTSFNGIVGAHRAFGHVGVPMDAVRGLKRRFGGSVDDVLLALVAAGIVRTQDSPPPAMRAMLPVSTRPAADGRRLGNQVTAVFVDLPLDTTELGVLVRRIAASKSVLRNTHAAAGMSMLIQAAGLLPHPLHRSLVRLAAAIPAANLVLSDVPGPDDPLVFLGRPIVAGYPMIPLPAAVGLSVAAISMGGQMGIGIVSDPRLVPKPQRLAAAIGAAVKAAVGTKRAPRVPLRGHRRAA